jgi:all-trans-retinol 13,14-reductase
VSAMRPAPSYDAIVIGSGIGGLAAAAVLARVQRHRVLVLEQHFKLGGFLHTFQRPGGYEWDVGLHYVGEMTPGSTMRTVMDFVTAGAVDWVPMKDPFEVFLYPGLKVELPAGARRTLAALTALFPAEAAALRRYLRDVHWAANSLSGEGMRSTRLAKHRALVDYARALPQLTLKRYLDARFQDPRLKAVVASQWGDYGLPPGQSSFGLHASVVKHYLEGGFYPRGSSASLATAMAAVIEGAGGSLRVRHRVKRILVEDGRAIGVEAEGPNGVERFTAPEVYSDAGAEATFGRLLDRAAIDPAELKELGEAAGHGVVTLYLGLRSAGAHLGLHGQNIWIYDGFDHDAIWARRNLLAQGEASSCYLSFPGLKNPLARKPTAEIIAPLDHEVFAPWTGTRWMKRGGEYRALKERITTTLLAFVEERLPGFGAEVATTELATPLSVEHFTGHRRGVIYGHPGTPRRFSLGCLRPRTPIKGLVLVGADAGGLGITRAMMGGVLGVAALHGLGVLPRVMKVPPP